MVANSANIVEDTVNAYERCVLILINIEERHEVDVINREGEK